jgi:hypothetical protein
MLLDWSVISFDGDLGRRIAFITDRTDSRKRGRFDTGGPLDTAKQLTFKALDALRIVARRNRVHPDHQRFIL